MNDALEVSTMQMLLDHKAEIGYGMVRQESERITHR